MSGSAGEVQPTARRWPRHRGEPDHRRASAAQPGGGRAGRRGGHHPAGRCSRRQQPAGRRQVGDQEREHGSANTNLPPPLLGFVVCTSSPRAGHALERGMVGVYPHCGEQHLTEFDFLAFGSSMPAALPARLRCPAEQSARAYAPMPESPGSCEGKPAGGTSSRPSRRSR